jgi:hypothetical protein
MDVRSLTLLTRMRIFELMRPWELDRSMIRFGTQNWDGLGAWNQGLTYLHE